VRPAELVAIVEFDLQRNHGIIVEQILITKALYIQAGRNGDRLIHDLNLPKVILEVPELGFASVWEEIYLRHVIAQMRERGLSRANAKRVAKQAIEEMRKLAAIRMRPDA
jgi:hypothetical protein